MKKWLYQLINAKKKPTETAKKSSDKKTPWRSKPFHKRHGWVLHPSTQTFFWLSTYLLAGYISIYSTELKSGAANIIPSVKAWLCSSATDTSTAASVPAVDVITAASTPTHTLIVLAIALMLSGLFAFTAFVKAKREDYILQTQQTSPPETFWGHFEDAVSAADAAYKSAIYNLSIGVNAHEGLSRSLRSVLSALCELVREWDTANIERRVVYRANIMKVVYFDEDNTFTIPAGGEIDHSRFLHQPMREHHSGVVYMDDYSLTASTSVSVGEPDTARKPIYFPFCLIEDEDKSGKFISNLRGAPYTVVTLSPDIVSDTKNIIDHYKVNAEPLSKVIIGHLKQYYNHRQQPAKSILSIPLFRPPEQLEDCEAKDTQQNKRVQWVLNIYRDQPGMLYTTDVNRTFCKVISGITARMAEVLNLADPIVAESNAQKDTEAATLVVA